MQYISPTLTEKEGALAYKNLKKIILENELLERSYGFYAYKIIFSFLAFLASGFFIYTSSNPLIYILASITLAFFTVQMAGLMHEAGHRAILVSSRSNDAIGYFLSFWVAVSYEYWRTSHNEHHAHTNEETKDPDIDLALHGFTKDRARYSNYIAKWFARHQAYFFHAYRVLSVFSFRISSIQYEIQKWHIKHLPRIMLFLIGLFVWTILPFLILPVSQAIIVFLITHACVGFYMSNIFAPNHKAMPYLRKDTKMSFFEHQIRTSRNINSSRLKDYLFMGLHYQIEHHLFPSCPRNKLKKVSQYVKAACKAHNLEYTTSGVIETNKIILATLTSISLELE